MSAVTVFYGAASGSEQKALRVLEEPRVCISYVTKNNRPWPSIESLLVDSGGFSVLDSDPDYQDPPEAYLEYLREHEDRLELFALRDYPTAPAFLDRWGRTVSEHQRLTTDRHRELLDLLDDDPLDADPIAVLQGARPAEYVAHLDDLRDAGVLDAVDVVGIGSLVGDHLDVDDVRTITSEVAAAIPSRLELHGFGISRDALHYPEVVDAFDTVDSVAYGRRARWAPGSTDFKAVAWHYLKFKRRIEYELVAVDVDGEGTAHYQGSLAGRWGA